jgi:CHAT domain-containing protein
MLQQWFSAYGVEPLYERIHTIHDLEKFLHQEGRNVSTRFVHITCHGKDEQGCGTAKLCLTFDDVDLVRNADIFKGLDGKVIVFSCCQVGNDERAMLAVKEASGAAAIIGYRMSVKDSYANLAEVLLYDRLLIPHMKVAEAVKQVQSTLKWGEGTLSNSFILFSPFLFPHPR